MTQIADRRNRLPGYSSEQDYYALQRTSDGRYTVCHWSHALMGGRQYYTMPTTTRPGGKTFGSLIYGVCNYAECPNCGSLHGHDVERDFRTRCACGEVITLSAWQD